MYIKHIGFCFNIHLLFQQWFNSDSTVFTQNTFLFQHSSFVSTVIQQWFNSVYTKHVFVSTFIFCFNSDSTVIQQCLHKTRFCFNIHSRVSTVIQQWFNSVYTQHVFDSPIHVSCTISKEWQQLYKTITQKYQNPSSNNWSFERN